LITNVHTLCKPSDRMYLNSNRQEVHTLEHMLDPESKKEV